MDDLNDGLRTPGAIMLGGGNPAAIPEMLDYFRLTMRRNAGRWLFTGWNDQLRWPQGKDVFIKALAKLFRETYGWNISKRTSATNGSQSGFFYLFNLFAGKQPDGSFKKILLPLAPRIHWLW